MLDKLLAELSDRKAASLEAFWTIARDKLAAAERECEDTTEPLAQRYAELDAATRAAEEARTQLQRTCPAGSGIGQLEA